MRAKLFSIPEATLELLISLESREMIPVLARSGIQVTEEEIKKEIYKDQAQEVLITFHGDAPKAWIRYGIEDKRIFVKSIQVNHSGGSMGALRSLLREILVELGTMSETKIESVVQLANARSLALHEKLGFIRVKEGSKAIRFSIDTETLRFNLKRFFTTD